VQNYITAILIFLVVEMLMTWGFYGPSDQEQLNCRMWADMMQTISTATEPISVPRCSS
jgi:hypothetical protein